ncbi:HD domain-containing protein [Clostridium estertheticum]|uniref:HD domain-containing protein n=1 Tax=Clostridium estertheticum TaxID=238834 RepID=UPI001CF15332|nr:HD domain-containing protein [Clostridium estertheticum]MCB2308376.1 HD domain-containing protein [Clostridium estertheticum]MCB2346429.1 HD domain-containing protein [Clostridium estertheticum]MCB2349397.1 HD domain-containing protein [Clostridium estertheticum]WAG46377.1 HD domain-containing protein [Clostridium estertheticum]
MQYKEDKDRLNQILLTSKNIKDNQEEILKLVPELIICVDCTQIHPNHIYNVYEHIEETVNKVDFNLILKLTTLFHDIGKPYAKIFADKAERFWGHEEISATLTRLILKRLKYDDDLISIVCKLIKYHDYKIKATTEGVSEAIELIGPLNMPYLLEVQTADLLSHAPKYYNIVIPILRSVQIIYKENFNEEFNK